MHMKLDGSEYYIMACSSVPCSESNLFHRENQVHQANTGPHIEDNQNLRQDQFKEMSWGSEKNSKAVRDLNWKMCHCPDKHQPSWSNETDNKKLVQAFFSHFTQCPCLTVLYSHWAVLLVVSGLNVCYATEWQRRGPGWWRGSCLMDQTQRNPSAGPWEPKMTLPPPATSWVSCIHIWTMVRIWIRSYVLRLLTDSPL